MSSLAQHTQTQLASSSTSSIQHGSGALGPGEYHVANARFGSGKTPASFGKSKSLQRDIRVQDQDVVLLGTTSTVRRFGTPDA
eukprot:CAMPEP_0171999806 /NCGR_PEP_ID=MMETSP1041-20130122/1974_1 /TAXON_ID=464988 /ORGANISM="Hemiselmis andersenii, Strain CCMP439" /LENGTH=82 /DNA_ID=CAMNT_0012653287 /DNA_START=91 /DNA_END=335 /DNA_ORIENTATION=-